MSNHPTLYDLILLHTQFFPPKYLSGQITFQDYLYQLDPDDEEEGEEIINETINNESIIDTSDQDWFPGGGEPSKKPINKKPTKKAIDEFAQDLQATTKQQLGRKLPRLGVVRGKRKRLDPTLQVCLNLFL